MNNQQLEQMSWKIFKIKDALGTQTIRNQILKKLINANTQRKLLMVKLVSAPE